MICIVTLHRGTPNSVSEPALDELPTTNLNQSNPAPVESSALQNSLNPKISLDNKQASGLQRRISTAVVALQQQRIKQSNIGAWISKQPLIHPSRGLGLSRPAWRSYDSLSLQERYGQEPLTKIYTVMIDPGHGGSDPGAKGHNGLLEKEITLDIAQRAALFLSEVKNVRVQLTRQSDRGMSRADRVSEIKNSNSDLVVSLHLNHLPQTELTLVETFYAGPENIRESQLKQAEQKAAGKWVKTAASHSHDLRFTKQSRALAHIMQARIYDEVKMSNKSADSAGVKQDTLFVLTRSFTPGALIELTCLSNEEEAVRLGTEEYRNRLAAALADGIRDYVELATSAESI